MDHPTLPCIGFFDLARFGLGFFVTGLSCQVWYEVACNGGKL